MRSTEPSFSFSAAQSFTLHSRLLSCAISAFIATASLLLSSFSPAFVRQSRMASSSTASSSRIFALFSSRGGASTCGFASRAGSDVARQTSVARRRRAFMRAEATEQPPRAQPREHPPLDSPPPAPTLPATEKPMQGSHTAERSRAASRARDDPLNLTRIMPPQGAAPTPALSNFLSRAAPRARLSFFLTPDS